MCHAAGATSGSTRRCRVVVELRQTANIGVGVVASSHLVGPSRCVESRWTGFSAGVHEVCWTHEGSIHVSGVGARWHAEGYSQGRETSYSIVSPPAVTTTKRSLPGCSCRGQLLRGRRCGARGFGPTRGVPCRPSSPQSSLVHGRGQPLGRVVPGTWSGMGAAECEAGCAVGCASRVAPQ